MIMPNKAMQRPRIHSVILSGFSGRAADGWRYVEGTKVRSKGVLRLFGVMTLIAAVTGWSAAPSAAAPAAALALDELESRVAKDGSLTFRSWNGKLIGMDSDTEITFLPNRVVHMTEYGYTPISYKGTYSVDAKGEVKAKFNRFNHEWPVMLVQKDSASLLLSAKSGPEFVMGNRGGTYIPGGKGSYWPFRPVSPKEEAEIRQRIGK